MLKPKIGRKYFLRLKNIYRFALSNYCCCQLLTEFYDLPFLPLTEKSNHALKSFLNSDTNYVK